jgi:hypothetical protein
MTEQNNQLENKMQDQVFHHFFNGRWIVIHLNESNNWTWEDRYHYNHDEGWSSLDERIYANDYGVFLDSHSDGRDCDGSHSYNATYCMNGLKETNIPGIFSPEWERTRSEVYDQYAQAANY